MADLINRDHAAQAIEAYLCSQCDYDTERDPECIACPHLDGGEILKSVPAVNRWISCSDRLPESLANKVIVFCTGEDVSDYVGFGHYEKLAGDEIWFNLETGKPFAYWGLTVKKWMPLPEKE